MHHTNPNIRIRTYNMMESGITTQLLKVLVDKAKACLKVLGIMAVGHFPLKVTFFKKVSGKVMENRTRTLCLLLQSWVYEG